MRLPAASVLSPPQSCSLSVALLSVRPPTALELATSSTPSCGPVIALFSERLARRDAEFSKLDEAFFGREDLALESEQSLAKTASSEANICSQASVLQADVAAMRADLTASESSIATATFESIKLRADNRRSTSRPLELTSTADGWVFSFPFRTLSFLRLLSIPDVVSLTAIWAICNFWLVIYDRIDSDFTTLVARVRDRRPILRWEAVPSTKAFRAPADEDDITKGAFLPPLTD